MTYSKYIPKVQFCDNQSAIAFTKNLESHVSTEHIDMQLHFVGEHVSNGTIDFPYYPTNDMIADVLTKPLARKRHVKLMELMGMQYAMPSQVENAPVRKEAMERSKGSA